MAKLYFLVGIPGSGKSTWAKEKLKNEKNTKIVSSDTIRKEKVEQKKIYEIKKKNLVQKRFLKWLTKKQNNFYQKGNQ